MFLIYVVLGAALGGAINRLRGKESYFVWLGCAALAAAVWFGSPAGPTWWVAAGAILTGLGYVLGESFGWTKILWATKKPRSTQEEWNNHPYLLKDDTGEKYGFYWLTEKIVGNESEDYRKFWKVGAFFRAAYWWVPVYIPLVTFGVTPWWYAVPAVALLSLAFWECYDRGFDGSHARSEIYYGIVYGAILGASIAI